MPTSLLALVVGAVAGLVAGYFIRYAIALSKKKSLEIDVKQIRLEAKEEAQSM